MNEAPESPWVYILIGAFISAFGGASLLADGVPTWASFGIIWFGSVTTTIGIIAAGVMVGSARGEWKRARRR